jgi:RimJ/RimL family protein N-acetyltransferase
MTAARGQTHRSVPDRAAVHLRPWREADLSLLEALLGDPTMMRHLGGPESDEKIAERHARYLTGADADSQFRIVDDATGEAVGWVGYWERAWRDQEVYEIGWSGLPGPGPRHEFEYPPGSFMRCNDWRLDLFADE